MKDLLIIVLLGLLHSTEGLFHSFRLATARQQPIHSKIASHLVDASVKQVVNNASFSFATGMEMRRPFSLERFVVRDLTCDPGYCKPQW